MNEICIVYDSPHKGNTEKLLLKIKEKYADTALVKAADCTPEFFFRYDVLGFASGIYYGKFSPSVSAVLEQAIKSDVKKLFFIYTSGAGRSGYENALRAKTEKSGKICLGIFSCKGFDTYGPFKLIGGLNKGRPNEDDFRDAIAFFENDILAI